MRSGGRVVLVVACLLGLLGVGSPALAHNQLTSSDPEDGAQVGAGPDEVALSFLASLDPDNSELAVTGPDGESAVAGDPEFDGAGVTIPVRTALVGDYEIGYEVLSTDGHQVEGTVTFTVTEGEEPAGPSPEPEASGPEATAGPGATGEPAPTAAGSPAPASGATSDDGGSGLAWWVWALLALVLAAAGYTTYRLRAARLRATR